MPSRSTPPSSQRGPRNRALLVGVSVLALSGLGAGLGYYARAKPGPAASGANDVCDTGAKDDEIARLRAEVLRLAAQLEAAKLAANAFETKGDDKPARRAPPRPPTPEEENAWFAARSQFFDESLNREARNDAWASALEAKATKLVAEQKDRGVQLVSTRCWTNHCRMEYAYRDGDARGDHLRTVPPAFPELPRVAYAYPAGLEGNRAVLYMTTADHHMPDFDYDAFKANSKQ